MTYNEFCYSALNQDMSERRKRIAFSAIARMNRKNRRDFIRYIFTGKLPDKEAEGFTLEMLIHRMQYTKVQAFLVFDWLQKDPKAALVYIYEPRPSHPAVSEETSARIREELKRRGYRVVDEANDYPLEINDEK